MRLRETLRIPPKDLQPYVGTSERVDTRCQDTHNWGRWEMREVAGGHERSRVGGLDRFVRVGWAAAGQESRILGCSRPLIVDGGCGLMHVS